MKMERGIFIAAHDPGSGKHDSAYVGEGDKSRLAGELDSLVSRFEPGARLSIRQVGTRKLISECQALLSARRIRSRKSVVRETPVDLFFDGSTGALRVSKEKLRVLIADDSATIRRLLEKIFRSEPEIEVVGSVGVPTEVDTLISKVHPHVLTLDLHMPEMNGVALLKQIMPRHWLPTVVISSIGMEEGPLVLEALEAGAIDYVQKPSSSEIGSLGPTLIEKIKTAATAKIRPVRTTLRCAAKSMKPGGSGPRLIAIGSSTGGTEALKSILTSLPAEIPPVVIVQHIPAGFSRAFAERMDSLCPFEVKEASHGDEVRPGRVLIAAGSTQMRFQSEGGKWSVAVSDDLPVNRHKPSVDVLFSSVARHVANQSVCVILTGMGSDGAKGLLECRKAGARTIAQDEESCAVFGMPREAIRLGAAEKVCSLSEIPEEIVKLLGGLKAAS